MSESWALNEQGRLYIPGLTPESISYDVEHRNYGSFYLADTHIDADAIPDPVGWTMPLPLGVWRISTTGKLRMSGCPSALVGSAPYPFGVWFKDIAHNSKLHEGGMPYALLPTPPYPPYMWHTDESQAQITQDCYNSADILGAFANANSLGTTATSQSLQKIGEFSFRNTALESVILPQGCTYYDTSFPDDCEVIQ